MPILSRVVSPEVFDHEWRALHDAVFCGRSAEDRPFRDPAWEMILLPEGMALLALEQQVFNAIAGAAQQMGDSEVIITDANLRAPAAPALIIP